MNRITAIYLTLTVLFALAVWLCVYKSDLIGSLLFAVIGLAAFVTGIRTLKLSKEI